ncbi:MAG: class I SAM-dependent methyltransferase [Lachnospiraceae bacterium]|nr:class I SAM-dependent methyltransferase [Lachnospiraceae bacterium]
MSIALRDEFETLLKNKVYLFGNGSVSRILQEIIEKIGFKDHVKGIILSNVSDKDTSMYKIFGADEIEDKNTPIIIATSVKFEDEIKKFLVKKGFTAIVPGFKYVHLFDEEDMGRELFGGKKFYQTLPQLGIAGVRPTDVRIEEYGLKEIVSGKKVVDIGCNCGFLDITISQYAESVTGIEYNDTLVNLSNAISNYLHVGNVTFKQGDFEKYVPVERFDVVLFFAVHGWINLPVENVVSKISSLLNDGGILVFESQKIEEDEELFMRYIAGFTGTCGMTLLKMGSICDDGVTNRKYVVLKA